MAKTTEKQCRSCTSGGAGGTILERCRCCEILDQDPSLKRVRWCRLCGVYLCESCRTSPLRRIQAFGRQFFQ